MTLRFAVLAVSLAAAQICSAQALEFKGVPMGTSLEQLESTVTISNRNCLKPIGDPDQSCWGSTDATYAGQVIKTIMVDLRNGQTAHITVATLGGSGEIIRSALVSKYGKPTGKRQVSKSMKNGIKYTMSVTEWRLRSGGLIAIEDHPQPVGEVYTSLMTPAWQKWQSEANKADRKAKADL
jgi:hypothetical protein